SRRISSATSSAAVVVDDESGGIYGLGGVLKGILRKRNSDSEYEMLDSRLNPHLFIGIVNASVVDSKEKETGRLGR
ncbi:unnamed protein product, partial [Brassica oleracea]